MNTIIVFLLFYVIINIGDSMLRLKETRIAFGLTQEELAEELNVKRNTICDWELKKTEPNIEQLKKLSSLFSISLDYLCNHICNDGTSIKHPNELVLKEEIKKLPNKKQEKLFAMLLLLRGDEL